MGLEVLKRIDDLAFIEWLMDRAVNIIIVPKRNLLIAWSREEIMHERVIEKKRLRNGLWLVRCRLTL